MKQGTHFELNINGSQISYFQGDKGTVWSIDMFKKNEIKHKVEEYIINHKIDISRYDLYQIMDLYDDNKDELCGYSFNYLSKERSEGKATCFCVLYEFPDIINRGNDEIQINYL